MMLLTRTTPKYFRCQTEKIFNEFLFQKQTISNIDFLFFIYSSKLTSMHCFLGMKKQKLFSLNTFLKTFDTLKYFIHSKLPSEKDSKYVQIIQLKFGGVNLVNNNSMSEQFRRQHHWEERGASAFFFPCYPMLCFEKRKLYSFSSCSWRNTRIDRFMIQNSRLWWNNGCFRRHGWWKFVAKKKE